jgi:hypothetical protein
MTNQIKFISDRTIRLKKPSAVRWLLAIPKSWSWQINLDHFVIFFTSHSTQRHPRHIKKWTAPGEQKLLIKISPPTLHTREVHCWKLFKYFVSQLNSGTLCICLSLLQLYVVGWEQSILAMTVPPPPAFVNLNKIQGHNHINIFLLPRYSSKGLRVIMRTQNAIWT